MILYKVSDATAIQQAQAFLNSSWFEKIKQEVLNKPEIKYILTPNGFNILFPPAKMPAIIANTVDICYEFACHKTADPNKFYTKESFEDFYVQGCIAAFAGALHVMLQAHSECFYPTNINKLMSLGVIKQITKGNSNLDYCIKVFIKEYSQLFVDYIILPILLDYTEREVGKNPKSWIDYLERDAITDNSLSDKTDDDDDNE